MLRIWRRASRTRPLPANWRLLWTPSKHVGHVLGMLAAANRTEVVSPARELSLIP